MIVISQLKERLFWAVMFLSSVQTQQAFSRTSAATYELTGPHYSYNKAPLPRPNSPKSITVPWDRFPRQLVPILRTALQIYVSQPQLILILCTSMIRCIPWPPGAREEQIRIPPVPLQFFFIFHICEGEGGKHYEPYKISTSSLREG